MPEQVIISSKFCGPPDSGNGGYVCGLVANFIGPGAEVILRKPVPLEKPLSLITDEDHQVTLMDGKTVTAIGRPTAFDLEIPDPPSFSKAKDAEKRYVGHGNHIFPTCFVCGPRREAGDGLRIFSGPLINSKGVASSWIPHDSLLDQDGMVAPEFIWASLDCPGYFAIAGDSDLLSLLGRMTGQLHSRPKAGEPCILLGWELGTEGRKRYAGTAIFSEDGALHAAAKSTWYDIKV